MAAQVIGQQSSASIPQGKRAQGQKARDFFSDMGDFLRLYLGPGLSIPQREKRYWATLNEKQKAEIRYDLLRRN